METKMKFKKGDKVRVKSLEWYNGNKDTEGNIINKWNYPLINFIKDMARYCGQIFQILEIENDYYLLHDNAFCWQDWMLEDEVVGENIETKIMTKKQAQDVVRGTKYYLKNENESANLQNKLLEIGCKWISGCKEVQHEEQKYLFVSDYLNITVSEGKDIFMEDLNEELNVNDVLNIEIKDMIMETTEKKEMTQKEVFEYLNDTKILCTSKEESKKVQEKLFALGFSYYEEKSKEVVDCAFTLYIKDKKMQFGSDLSIWVEDSALRVEPSEVLAIQIKDEKPKFDPKTLQVYDKILVRCSKIEKWRARFFDSYENGFITANGSIFDYGVPYNEETKHLHGTTEEAPEFYKLN